MEMNLWVEKVMAEEAVELLDLDEVDIGVDILSKMTFGFNFAAKS